MTDYIVKAQEIINKSKYVQFSASWCPDCVYAKSIWTKFNVLDKFYIFDIASYSKPEQEQWRQAFLKVCGSRNLPTIFVDGKVWGTEADLHKFERKGTLQDELKKIGLL